MKKLVIKGWNPGFDKILLTKIIRANTRISLSAGKNCTDRVLGHEIVTFDSLDLETAERFLRDVRNVGCIGEIVDQ